MSKIGKLPIAFPGTVKVKIHESVVTVEGPKGTLHQRFEPQYVTVQTEAQQVLVKRLDDTKAARARHGLYRSLIANMVKGVQEHYKKTLVLIGLGYKAQAQGNKVVVDVGFAESKTYVLPEGVKAEVANQTELTLSGADKHKVGLAAAEIRMIRKPEPYNGTGIRYKDERVRHKAGKLAA
ncbi:MAG TPA: 50S ribosomal protein L6 [Candidatus Bipolaricaulota bacterium]